MRWTTARDPYVTGGPFASGFAIVKQSFAADTRAPKDLFVIAKVGPQDGTDESWIYGTVAVDGTVTSAGRVASCMGCHDHDAAHERLFGLASAQ